jgi:putative phage-type endonuclease
VIRGTRPGIGSYGARRVAQRSWKNWPIRIAGCGVVTRLHQGGVGVDKKSWLEGRRKGLGSSDCAAVLGLNPMKTPIEVFLEKTGRENMLPTRSEAEEDLLESGHDLEPYIAKRYERRTKLQLEDPQGKIFQHPKHAWMLACPDRLLTPLEKIVELKSELPWMERFGSEGTDEAPEIYLCQVAHQMAVLGWDRADIALLHGTRRFGIYTIERDLELEEIIIERLSYFWHNFVLRDIEPPVDSSPAWAEYIQRKFPHNRGEIVKVTAEENPEVVAEVRHLLDCIQEADLRGEEAELLKNRLKAFIADRDGLETPDGTITFRRCKDTMGDVTDWRGALTEISLAANFPTAEALKIVEKWTAKEVIKHGSRRFLLKPAKQEKEELVHVGS